MATASVLQTKSSQKSEDSTPRIPSAKNLRHRSTLTHSTEAALALQTIQHIGDVVNDTNGSTLIHYSVAYTPTMVHVCASQKVPINNQNFAGDTALHLAVRLNKPVIANALCMVGADPTIKNKLGLTPLDEASDDCRDLCAAYHPGLVVAIKKSKMASVLKILRFWPNLNSIIYKGETALTLARQVFHTKQDEPSQLVLNKLQEFKDRLDFVHAVLREDCDEVSRLIKAGKMINVNTRFRWGELTMSKILNPMNGGKLAEFWRPPKEIKGVNHPFSGEIDHFGWTPACFAIKQRNLLILKLLVEEGHCDLNIRIRETPSTTRTIPLYFLTLEKGCPVQIWEYVKDNIDEWQHTDCDLNGNSGIFYALASNRSTDFIMRLIKWQGGKDIYLRNPDDMTPKQVALDYGRLDLSFEIDEYLVDHIGSGFLINLPVKFYPHEDAAFISRDGIPITEIAEESGCVSDYQAIQNYPKIKDVGSKLFQAASIGALKNVVKFNQAAFRDQNGFTALIKAIVYQNLEVVDILMTERPELNHIPDNCHRYPLHYAYALNEDCSDFFVKLLSYEQIEKRQDMFGRYPMDYSRLRDSEEVMKMIHDARMLDPYGRPYTFAIGNWSCKGCEPSK